MNILILINPILAEPVSMSKCLYSILNKLAGLQQNEVVDNKRLGSVLAHIQQQHEELESWRVEELKSWRVEELKSWRVEELKKQNKRSRAKKNMPSRKAQKADIEQRK